MPLLPLDPDKHTNVPQVGETFKWSMRVSRCGECPSFTKEADSCDDIGMAVDPTSISRKCPRIKRQSISALDVSKHIDWHDYVRNTYKDGEYIEYTTKNGVKAMISVNHWGVWRLPLVLEHNGTLYDGKVEFYTNSAAVHRDKIKLNIAVNTVRFYTIAECDYDFDTALVEVLEKASEAVVAGKVQKERK
jgi:hypothetical protein